MTNAARLDRLVRTWRLSRRVQTQALMATRKRQPDRILQLRKRGLRLARIERALVLRGPAGTA